MNAKKAVCSLLAHGNEAQRQDVGRRSRARVAQFGRAVMARGYVEQSDLRAPQ